MFVLFRPGTPKGDAAVGLGGGGGGIVPAPVASGKIEVIKAVYGVPGDAKRTRNVVARVKKLADAGELRFNVTRMADGDDPAFMVVKTLVVDYTVNGQHFSATGQDGQEIELALPPAPERAADLVRLPDGKLQLRARKGGSYSVGARQRDSFALGALSVPAPLTVPGPA